MNHIYLHRLNHRLDSSIVIIISIIKWFIWLVSKYEFDQLIIHFDILINPSYPSFPCSISGHTFRDFASSAQSFRTYHPFFSSLRRLNFRTYTKGSSRSPVTAEQPLRHWEENPGSGRRDHRLRGTLYIDVGIRQCASHWQSPWISQGGHSGVWSVGGTWSLMISMSWSSD